MNATVRNSAAPTSKAWKILGLIVIILFLALPSLAQNTKGDRPQRTGGSGGGNQRESRFKNIFKKKGPRKSKDATYTRRTQPRGPSRASSARRPAKPGKAQKASPQYSVNKSSPRQRVYSQKSVYVNNKSGKPSDKPRVQRTPRVKVRSSTGKSRNTYPQARYTRPRSISDRSRKVYSQSGRFVNNTSSKPRSTQRSVSNRGALARLKKLQGPEPSPSRQNNIRVIPRSASRSFTARRSINVYAHFRRPKKKSERAVTTDIAGRKLRTKNFETQRPGPAKPLFNAHYGRKRVGDRPYRGPAAGGYRSATRTTPQAWTGDIAKRRIRGKNFTSKKNVEGQPILYAGRRVKDRFGDRQYRGSMPGGGYRSASGRRVKNTALPGRAPGIGANGVNYQGRIKGGRPLKGGGSVSGRGWNNKGVPIAVRIPREERIGSFQGNVKRGRPLKGGGSVSGSWNNKGVPVAVRIPREQRVGSFQGNIKRGRPLKGGGSVSGRAWNNKGVPIAVRTPREERPGTFQGNIKRGRPLKGGGSVSGKTWNNDEKAIPARIPAGRDAAKVAGFPGKMKRFGASPGFNDQGEEFTGTIKGRRPLKGGGSVSGKLWNNDEKPIKRSTIPPTANEVGGFPGKMKRFESSPGFNDQGEEFTGHIKRPRFRKDYIQNDKAAETSIRKKRPNENAYKAEGLQIRVQQRPNGHRDNAIEGTLPGLKPTAETVKASQYARGVRRTWNYIHNSSSAEEALKVREPGKAFAKATDYQGNIKMQRFKLFDKKARQLHPDAQFVKINKNNVDSERDMLTNFKLWWARLFKKQETQPDHLKDKGHKPRYDKGEDGLWYD